MHCIQVLSILLVIQVIISQQFVQAVNGNFREAFLNFHNKNLEKAQTASSHDKEFIYSHALKNLLLQIDKREKMRQIESNEVHLSDEKLDELREEWDFISAFHRFG